MRPGARIYVAGHRGLAGGAITRRLAALGHSPVIARTHAELDLRDQAAVLRFFRQERPEYVFLAAARVGGIHANRTRPAEFLYDNLLIAANVIHAAHLTGVTKLLNLGSTCVYPREAPQPMREDALLTGPLEETNRAYAVAKIAAVELCDHYRTQYGRDFISAMPTNLYGPGDNFDPLESHVLPALVRKMVEARETDSPTVTVWGSGAPRREFLHTDDLADACVFLIRHFSAPGPLNVGTGEDLSIRDLAGTIRAAVGYRGELVFDSGKPDGTPRKVTDVGRLHALGWRHRIRLEDGLRETVEWYLAHRDRVRGAGVHP